MAAPRDLYSTFPEQPKPPVGGLKRIEPDDWIEVPLIADDPDLGLPRKVFGRISANGNLEVGIESAKALEALRHQARGTSAPAPLPAGTTDAERAAFYRAHTPRPGQAGAERVGSGGAYPQLPEELAPNIREERLRLLQAQRYGKPLISAFVSHYEFPLNAPGRAAPRQTAPERRAFATALVPAAALHALDAYLSKTSRTDAQVVVAAAFALFTSRFSYRPMGFYGGPGQQTSAREAYHSGVTADSYVPGTFPPGYSFTERSVATSVPVTTDTIAALEFFVRNKLRGGAMRGRGVYRSFSPPRRTRIANYLQAARWQEQGRTPGFNVVLWRPPAGAPPAG